MTEAFRGECLSLAAQLEQYAKIDGTLPGVIAAMQESAAALRRAAKPDEDGVREALRGTAQELRWCMGQLKQHGYTFANGPVTKALEIAETTLSTTGEPKP